MTENKDEAKEKRSNRPWNSCGHPDSSWIEGEKGWKCERCGEMAFVRLQAVKSILYKIEEEVKFLERMSSL